MKMKPVFFIIAAFFAVEGAVLAEPCLTARDVTPSVLSQAYWGDNYKNLNCDHGTTIAAEIYAMVNRQSFTIGCSKKNNHIISCRVVSDRIIILQRTCAKPGFWESPQNNSSTGVYRCVQSD